MARQEIEVPGEGRRFVTTQEAVEWLRISEATFERMVRRETWVRRIKEAKKLMWNPTDIGILAHMMERMTDDLAEDEPAERAKKS